MKHLFHRVFLHGLRSSITDQLGEFGRSKPNAAPQHKPGCAAPDVAEVLTYPGQNPNLVEAPERSRREPRTFFPTPNNEP
jgi:hypothetical protein